MAPVPARLQLVLSMPTTLYVDNALDRTQLAAVGANTAFLALLRPFMPSPLLVAVAVAKLPLFAVTCLLSLSPYLLWTSYPQKWSGPCLLVESFGYPLVTARCCCLTQPCSPLRGSVKSEVCFSHVLLNWAWTIDHLLLSPCNAFCLIH